MSEANEHLARCQAIAPKLAAIDVNVVSDLLERIDTAPTSDHADNWRSILSAAEATAASSGATVHDVGTVAPLRADHLRIVDRPFDSEAVEAAQRQVDAWTAQGTSTVKVGRSKRGPSRKVIRHGRALVVGDSDAFNSRWSTPIPREVLTHALDETRTVRDETGNVIGERTYADGVAVARVATLAFDLPPLIGGETTSWSEVLPEEVSGLIDWNVAGHTTGAWIKTGETAITWPTRYRLRTVRLRTGETGQRVAADGTVHLLAPSADIGRAFLGHRAYVRPASRGNRAERAARARTYDAVTIPAGADPLTIIGGLIDDIGNGAKVRVTTHDRTLTGTLTRGQSGKVSATFGDVKVKGARTVAAVLKGIAPAFI